MSFDLATVRADFPILKEQIHGHRLVYLDSAASAQKPQAVLDRMDHAYEHEYANVHRGLHTLANRATEAYEGGREQVRKFLNAARHEEIVLTKSATEAINLVASSFAGPRISTGDEIVLTVMENHSNIVPWHFLRERQGAVLKWVDVRDDGSFDIDAFEAALSPKTRMVAVTHMSNVLGTVVDVAAICAGARERGVPVLVDGSQAAVHMPVDVAALGCDFYAVTGHKLYGPSGSGAIFIRRERLDEMRPFMGGGDMIREVARERVTWNDPPMKFEAGTPGIVNQIGLGVALDYMTGLGVAAIAAHERALRDYARVRLDGLNWLTVQGRSDTKGAIFSFTLDGAAHAHDISTVLDKRGIAVRAGTHCAMPLMTHLGLGATCRASFGLYNTTAEVDALVAALELCHDLFG